jgi:hypothetical protein
MAVVSLWVVGARVKSRWFQRVDRAADRVAAQLGRNLTADGHSSVDIWDCHPLTVPMIKDLAESQGFRFHEENYSRQNGARVLRFSKPRTKPGSLSLDL